MTFFFFFNAERTVYTWTYIKVTNLLIKTNLIALIQASQYIRLYCIKDLLNFRKTYHKCL